MTRVFLLDDHELVRRGIADVIERAADLEVVGEAGTVRDAVARVEATRPDVVVLDVRLPDGSGVDACRRIRSRHPDLPCLMLTAFDDDSALDAAVLAGAQGWLLKDIRGAGLVDAIRRVAAGGQLMDREVVRRARARILAPATPAGEPQLTLREGQILALITEGLTNRQIGERLGLAEKTVKNYVSGLLEKIGVERRTQAAVYGMTHPRRPRA
ncbi:Transcriptional regulatory protein DevR (DosR) [Clavibacter michiganensis subsp. michiganensis]|uniref:response regulator transcription factor n=1 Tax=Clavibacter michiganensis TaxID=28447 RepID=UPI000A36D65F|nr:response regulator transcription factor [Clavibacter michiganensis]OUD90592.1 Transcriptional regulatory protein DevR (DosR) [Clavibacter michiganensis subsp. michiganensis]OUE11564.1 Transcriptional regulatory protein DevR (DosR) [Clavibacter michiganensis subsp. michiganensis]